MKNDKQTNMDILALILFTGSLITAIYSLKVIYFGKESVLCVNIKRKMLFTLLFLISMFVLGICIKHFYDMHKQIHPVKTEFIEYYQA